MNADVSGPVGLVVGEVVGGGSGGGLHVLAGASGGSRGDSSLVGMDVAVVGCPLYPAGCVGGGCGGGKTPTTAWASGCCGGSLPHTVIECGGQCMRGGVVRSSVNGCGKSAGARSGVASDIVASLACTNSGLDDGSELAGWIFCRGWVSSVVANDLSLSAAACVEVG